MEGNKKNELLEAALRYRHERGWSVIPVGSNKVPAISWKEFQTRIASEAEIREWWQKNPGTQLGVVTGAISNLVVVDVENEGDFEGYPETVTAKTGGEGRHYFFKHPGRDVKNGVRVRPLTDIRGDGGYVVVAPSRSEKGAYQWLVSSEGIAPPALPAWGR